MIHRVNFDQRSGLDAFWSEFSIFKYIPIFDNLMNWNFGDLVFRLIELGNFCETGFPLLSLTRLVVKVGSFPLLMKCSQYRAWMLGSGSSL